MLPAYFLTRRSPTWSRALQLMALVSVAAVMLSAPKAYAQRSGSDEASVWGGQPEKGATNVSAGAWSTRTPAALIIPIFKGKPPYDEDHLRSVVSAGWTDVIGVSSRGTARLDLTVLPWLSIGDPGLFGRWSLDPIRALKIAETMADFADFADAAGHIRAVVIAVPGDHPSTEVQAVHYRATKAGRPVIVDNVVEMTIPTGDKHLASLARIRPLLAVLGLDETALIEDSHGTVALSAEARATLGWTEVRQVRHTSQVSMPTTGPGANVVYEVPLFGDYRGSSLFIEPVDAGAITLRQVELGAHQQHRRLVRAQSVQTSQIMTTIPLSERNGDVDHAVIVGWEGNNAVLQINLSNTGVDLMRNRKKEQSVIP